MAITATATSFGYACTGNLAAGDVITTARIRVKSIQFNPGAAGATLQITDTAGNEVAYLLGANTRDTVAIDLYETWFDGLKVGATSGTPSAIQILAL